MTRQAQVLKYINDVRHAYLGLKPLSKLRKGVPRQPNDCPITNSLYGDSKKTRISTHIGTYGNYIDIVDSYGHLERVWAPQYVDSFVKGFDNGRHPDLVRK